MIPTLPDVKKFAAKAIGRSGRSGKHAEISLPFVLHIFREYCVKNLTIIIISNDEILEIVTYLCIINSK